MHNIALSHKHVAEEKLSRLYHQEESCGTSGQMCWGRCSNTHTDTHRTVREELSLNDVSRKCQLPNCAPAERGDSDKVGRPPYEDMSTNSQAERPQRPLTCLLLGCMSQQPDAMLGYFGSGSSNGWRVESERGNPCCNNNLTSSPRSSKCSAGFISMSRAHSKREENQCVNTH